MSKHLYRDMELLKKALLTLGSMVEDAINKAVIALVDRRSELTHEVITGDDLVDDKEVEIEEQGLKILALHQPVAADLRFIVGVLKVNNDLERMGDLAVNIAERADYLAKKDVIGVELDFPRMAGAVQKMVRLSLDALVNKDTDEAKKVLLMDDEVDALNRDMFVILQNVMRNDSQTIKRAVQLLSVSRHLERIADLATNIAEDVVFMVDGDTIRHKTEHYLE